MELQQKLHDLLIENSKQEGFPLAGTVDIDLVFSDPNQSFKNHLSHYDEWIEAGHAGSMEYLIRGRDRRGDPRLLFPKTQSILSVAMPYPRKPAGATNEKQGPKYARYLQGEDYHLKIAEKLERVMQATKVSWESRNQNANAETDLQWKICVDTSAVLERTWAALAGLGWIGKNTLLIHPQLGSYLFLAEVLINLKTGRPPAPLPNLCGNCTRCLTGCPTSAIEKPGILNSNRCISYLTLEKRGDLDLDPSTQNRLGSWIAGCDICQEICPFNIKPTRKELEGQINEDPALEQKNATHLNQWRELLLETPEQYKKRVQNSAMKRIKPAQFSRNLAISLGNAIDFSRPLVDLFLPLLPLIQSRLENEVDPTAKEEWRKVDSKFTENFYSPNLKP